MKRPVSGFGDNWRAYFVYLDCPMHIIYDATVKELSKNVREQYPNTLIVTLPFTEEYENGHLPTFEIERIIDISENLSCGRFDIRMIGIMVGGNCGEISFCCNIEERKVAKLVNTLFKKTAVTKLRYQFVLNDNFSYYDILLAPPHYEENCIKNREVYERLTANGEAFKEPREIDFTCCFSDPQHIPHIVDQFTDHFMEYGFHEVSREKEDNGEYWLQFTLEGIPSLMWIHQTTCWIIYSLKDTNGYFDGWGCVVVKGDNT